MTSHSSQSDGGSGLNGLRAIVSSPGTQHSLPAPPSREDFASDLEFEDANDEWWIKTHCWHVEIRPAT
jgi:hypothetical protein